MFSDSPGEILHCFLKKASGGALLSTSMWMGSGPCSRQKISEKHSFWLNPSLNGTTCFEQDCWMTPFHDLTSNHKMIEALSTQKTVWSPSLLFCFPRSYHPIRSHQQNITHVWTLLLHNPNKHLTKPRPHGSLAGSLDWKFFLQCLWYQLYFMQIHRMNASQEFIIKNETHTFHHQKLLCLD